jgi:hypothetical protein
MKYRKNEYRRVIQETFKGYGKGFSLLVLVGKGLDLGINPFYFVFVLVIRGSASAFYKSICLSLILKKPLKLNKAKTNFFFNTIPTIIAFIALSLLIKYTNLHVVFVLEKHITSIFVTYMILYRCIRMVTRYMKFSQKKDLKAASADVQKTIVEVEQTKCLLTNLDANVEGRAITVVS